MREQIATFANMFSIRAFLGNAFIFLMENTIYVLCMMLLVFFFVFNVCQFLCTTHRAILIYTRSHPIC